MKSAYSGARINVGLFCPPSVDCLYKWERDFLTIMTQLELDINNIYLAETLAQASTCKRRHHGAMIVPPRGLRALGFNHALDGKECEVCPREAAGIPSGTGYESCPAIHAEQDAICWATREGQSLVGSVLYVTGCPCSTCAKLIVASGISRVVIGTWAPQALTGVVDYLRRFGLQVDYLSDLEKEAMDAECAVCSNGSQTGNEDCKECPNGGSA